jgi:hypothetical protein
MVTRNGLVKKLLKEEMFLFIAQAVFLEVPVL